MADRLAEHRLQTASSPGPVVGVLRCPGAGRSHVPFARLVADPDLVRLECGYTRGHPPTDRPVGSGAPEADIDLRAPIVGSSSGPNRGAGIRVALAVGRVGRGDLCFDQATVVLARPIQFSTRRNCSIPQGTAADPSTRYARPHRRGSPGLVSSGFGWWGEMDLELGV
jgi:hypothetical protein